jgi:hypothetical protein
MFGKTCEVVDARRDDGYAPFVPCIYIYDNNPAVYSNPYVQRLVRMRWDSLDYFLVFSDTLNEVIRDSIHGRDHIKPGMVIWSMVHKILWSKVRYLHKLCNPTIRIQDDMLSAEDIVSCLPKEFEFPEFPGAPLLDVVESFIIQDMKQYGKLPVTELEIKEGILEHTVEGSVVAKVAVRCSGEGQMLEFVTRCSRIVLQKM